MLKEHEWLDNEMRETLYPPHFGVFPGVVGTILGLLLFCGVIIVQCFSLL